MYKSCRIILSTFALFLFFSGSGFITVLSAQGFSIPFYVRDNGTGKDTLQFGFDVNATYCIDYALGEYEEPPLPPDGVFEVRFIDSRNSSGACLGQGIDMNLHNWVAGIKDSFRVRFQGSSPSGGAYPFYFSWPSGLSTYFTSLTLKYSHPDSGAMTVDMLTNSSAVIDNAEIDKLYIICTTLSSGGFINVVSPNGGEHLYAENIHNIQWTSVVVANIKIDYSIDNGSTWSAIVSSTPASSRSYSWNVPNTPSSNCKIKISDANDSTLNDISNGVFYIHLPPTITVLPGSFAVNLHEGDSTYETLTIGNSGLGDLHWQINVPNSSESKIENLNVPAYSKIDKVDASMPIFHSDFFETTTHRNEEQNQYFGQLSSSPLFADGFEDGDYNGWVSNGSGMKEITNTTAANGSQYSYHEYNSPFGHGDGVAYVVDSLRPKYVGLYFRSGSTTQ
ncbi:MAG: hypothetical protein HYZ34_14640, partial [Ignavibacteriae bacterium]|nr:hypothetical protein [Ignavibacteriota bacterium]